MTTATAPKKRSLFEPDRHHLLPLDTPRLPKVVEESNRLAHRAFAAQEEAKGLADEANAPADAHPDDRARAVETAVALRAAKAELVRAVGQTYDAVADNHDAYLESRRAVADEAVAPLSGLAIGVIEKIENAQLAVEICRLAAIWHDNPATAVLSPGDSNLPRIGKAYEKALHSQRQHNRGNRPVPNELPELLAALTLKLEADYGVADG